MAKNYFNRYIWLIDLIQRSGHISFENIARAWRRSSLNQNGERLSERTFFNHKDAILLTFGLEIKCDRTLRGNIGQWKYYRTLPLHHSQEEGESTDAYTEFRYKLVPTFDFCRELLSKCM